MRNARAAALAELLEEAGQGRYIGTFGGPDQSPREMVDDHCEVALALPEGDLINPDPAQSCQLRACRTKRLATRSRMCPTVRLSASRLA
jgi:hypothetical protein